MLFIAAKYVESRCICITCFFLCRNQFNFLNIHLASTPNLLFLCKYLVFQWSSVKSEANEAGASTHVELPHQIQAQVRNSMQNEWYR